MSKFDTTLRDSQSTSISSIAPEQFDLQAYAEYDAQFQEKNQQFVDSDSGLLVYRRFRADGVFFDKCRSKEDSLALQLGALQQSMSYKADIANFLEPWYGIGYIAACFGADYIWLPQQAPAVKAMFASCQEILNADFKPISETKIGRDSLNMIEYFLDKTKGMVPISFTDIQSPLNMMSYLMSVNDLFTEVIDDPDGAQEVATLVTNLLIDFLKEQEKLLGNCLAKPGHGFASSRAFHGVGLSDDISLMLSADDYSDIFQPLDEKLGDSFGGMVYHSCGNWEKKIDMVQNIRGIVTADGAFSPETDPSPNDPAVFGKRFAGSGIVVNARAVGNPDDAFAALSKLWQPKQKMIAVTYCKTPEEQEVLYNRLHAMAD